MWVGSPWPWNMSIMFCEVFEKKYIHVLFIHSGWHLEIWGGVVILALFTRIHVHRNTIHKKQCSPWYYSLKILFIATYWKCHVDTMLCRYMLLWVVFWAWLVFITKIHYYSQHSYYSYRHYLLFVLMLVSSYFLSFFPWR